MNLNIVSDLRKPGLVPGKSLSLSRKFDSVLEKNQTNIIRFVFEWIGCMEIPGGVGPYFD